MLVRVRTVVALLVLELLLIAFAFQMGWLDFLVKARTRYLAQYQDQEWLNDWYGITIRQFPQDLMIYQNLLTRLKPDVIIETGTDAGGNTLYLATILEMVNPDAKILTVDIDPRKFRETEKDLKVAGRDRLLQRIQFFEGDSASPEILKKMKEAIPPKARVLVLLDSLHTRKHVYDELKLYADLVPVDSYIIVNDTHLEGWRSGETMSQPLSAVNDFLAEDDRFVKDETLNKFMISCSPSGFLKRVK